MKKVSINNELNGMAFSAIFASDEEMNAWIAACVENGCWGKAEREVLSDEGLSDRVLSTREISEERFGETIIATFYTIKADYVIEILNLDTDYNYLLEKCYENRRNAYPPIADYMDAIVKGDDVQKQTYIDACLAVKLQFPKPE